MINKNQNSTKKITIAEFVLLLVATSYAQHFGIQAGGLVSNFVQRTDLYSVNTVPKPGVIAGITLDIPLKNTMALNMGLNYKWCGAALLDSTDVAATRLGYINFDFTYDYIFETVGKIRPYVEGGGYAGYLVRAYTVYKLVETHFDIFGLGLDLVPFRL